MHALAQDLKKVPDPYREPLTRYIFHGPIPYAHPALLAALKGERKVAVEMDPAMTIVLAFLDKHETDLDIAHGHIAWLLRWQRLGGRVGRG